MFGDVNKPNESAASIAGSGSSRPEGRPVNSHAVRGVETLPNEIERRRCDSSNRRG